MNKKTNELLFQVANVLKDDQIELLKSEAEANFSASRWEDSAKTYEHLVGLAQKNGDFEQAIDFALAAIHAWRRMTGKESRINRLYQAVGLIALKKAAIGFEFVAEEAERANDLKTAAGNYEEAANGYTLIQSFDRAKQGYLKAIQLFERLAKKAITSKDFESSIHLYTRISEIYLTLKKLINYILIERKATLQKGEVDALLKEKEEYRLGHHSASKKIAEAHEQLADYYCSQKEPDYYLIADKELQKAIKILESINETQAAKKLKSKQAKIPKK